MATRDFLLPDLGEGLTEGEVVSWLVAIGDVIELDQTVAEIETAKAVVEVPSPFAGTVVTLHGEPGEEVMVGAPLITIDIGGEDEPTEVAEGSATADPVTGEEESGSVLVGYGTSAGTAPRRNRSGGAGSANGGPSGDGAAGVSPGGAGADEPRVVAREGKPLAKPPVRLMAKNAGIDLAAVPGTGAGGVITRADVDDFIAAQSQVGSDASQPDASQPDASQPDAAPPTTAAGQPASAPAEAAEAVAIPAAPEAALAQQRVPLGQMRKAIAAQMSRSRREIPEAVTWVEADATPLWEFRQQLNASQTARPDGVKVSALAIIMRMVVAGLRMFPTVNSSLDTTTQEMVLHRHINLGFAAQTDRGLVVPVIKGAQDMNILQLAAALNDLAQTARAGKLQPADMAGGTFTVSNYGAFGVDGGDMVINHPEAAILGTGRITDKPWVVDGQVAVRKVINYSIAFDHRLIDGGVGAGFIRHLADMTENPTLLTAAL